MSGRTMLAPGPFRAEHIPEGSSYELSNGHPVYCLPSGGRSGCSSLLGGEVLETDPAVKSAGVDVGFSKDPGHLRAPNVSVGGFAIEPGWAPGAPQLAVEYADEDEDEDELQKKIAEFLGAGSRYVWVVRLAGPRRVEVHEKDRQVRLAVPGEDLTAPGILQNPVPVLAFYDREVAHEAMLRNLLQRRGYQSIEAIRAEGKLQGQLEAELEAELATRRSLVFSVLDARGLVVSKRQRAQILATKEVPLLARWVISAVLAASTAEVLGGPKRARARRPTRP